VGITDWGCVAPRTGVIAGASTVKARSMLTNALGATPGACWTTFISDSAWGTVMLENAVISGTNALAGVEVEDCTTEMRLFAWSTVSGVALETLGISKNTAIIARFFIDLY
jgi:hypothetical protein